MSEAPSSPSCLQASLILEVTAAFLFLPNLSCLSHLLLCPSLSGTEDILLVLSPGVGWKAACSPRAQHHCRVPAMKAQDAGSRPLRSTLLLSPPAMSRVSAVSSSPACLAKEKQVTGPFSRKQPCLSSLHLPLNFSFLIADDLYLAPGWNCSYMFWSKSFVSF